MGKLGNLAVTDAALKPRPPVRLACLTTACAIRCSTPADLQSTFPPALYSTGENGVGPRAYNANIGVKYDDGAWFAALALHPLDHGRDNNSATSVSAFEKSAICARR